MGYFISIIKYAPAAIELTRLGIDLAGEAVSLWDELDGKKSRKRKRKRR